MEGAIPLTGEELQVLEAQSRQEDYGQKVTVTIAMYFTPQFKDKTGNVALKIANEVANAQLAYDNSQIPLELKVHCLKEVDLYEYGKAEEFLKRFENSQGEFFFFTSS